MSWSGANPDPSGVSFGVGMLTTQIQRLFRTNDLILNRLAWFTRFRSRSLELRKNVDHMFPSIRKKEESGSQTIRGHSHLSHNRILSSQQETHPWKNHAINNFRNFFHKKYLSFFFGFFVLSWLCFYINCQKNIYQYQLLLEARRVIQ